MSPILIIDTALEHASAAIVVNGSAVCVQENTMQKDHAAWLHQAIAGLAASAEIPLSKICAVAVSAGPGSYTGLRAGMAAAKGLCYALQIPLICVSTLEIIAESVKHHAAELIAPLIDARRMEVYTAIYDLHGKIIEQPHALILNEKSFEETLENHRVLFCGNGSIKLQKIISHANVSFVLPVNHTDAFCRLSYHSFVQKKFSNLLTTEPFYIKDFFTIIRKV